MRLSHLLPLVSLISPLLAAPADAVIKATSTKEAEAESTIKSTIFNGVEVPPLQELSGETLNKDIKQGYWFVVFYPSGTEIRS